MLPSTYITNPNIFELQIIYKTMVDDGDGLLITASSSDYCPLLLNLFH